MKERNHNNILIRKIRNKEIEKHILNQKFMKSKQRVKSIKSPHHISIHLDRSNISMNNDLHKKTFASPTYLNAKI